MGNCNFIKQEGNVSNTSISKNNFQFHYVIGRGTFGQVWKVQFKKNKQEYALKEMSKARIIHKKSINSVINEKQLLSILKHPFLANMIYAFQDRENLYLIMDLLVGGDLRYHICKQRIFNEEQTKFIICCIILGLEFIHLKGILHRDIKPENLVFDQNGYLRITDFGIARMWKQDNAQDTSGTPGYMAPEVMCRQDHGVAVDYYSLGVITYELMMGNRPYIGNNRKEIRDQILSKQVQIKRNDIPPGWSLDAADFINRLIQRKPVNRLGLNGPQEVKDHPWIKDFDWEKLYTKQSTAPFIPENTDNFDINVVNNSWADENPELLKQNQLQLRNSQVQSLFQYYDYQITTNEQQLALQPEKLPTDTTIIQKQVEFIKNKSSTQI